ncbi:hypothetical protein [Dactylosporangium cerinum]
MDTSHTIAIRPVTTAPMPRCPVAAPALSAVAVDVASTIGAAIRPRYTSWWRRVRITTRIRWYRNRRDTCPSARRATGPAVIGARVRPAAAQRPFRRFSQARSGFSGVLGDQAAGGVGQHRQPEPQSAAITALDRVTVVIAEHLHHLLAERAPVRRRVQPHQ